MMRSRFEILNNLNIGILMTDDNGIEYTETGPSTVAVRTVRGSPDKVFIPSKVIYKKTNTTYTVTSIGQGAFYNYPELKQIHIPESITSIGERAFFSSGLTEIVIPKNVKSIGISVFSFCTDLKMITIPPSLSTYFSDNLPNPNTKILVSENFALIHRTFIEGVN
jgi:hypothetical protein